MAQMCCIYTVRVGFGVVYLTDKGNFQSLRTWDKRRELNSHALFVYMRKLTLLVNPILGVRWKNILIIYL